MIETPRLRLRPWRDDDLTSFVALHADPDVMRDLGGPFDAVASKSKLNRYRAAYDACGVCRWAVESLDGVVLGYTGVMPSGAGHPLGAHFDIGWRFFPHAWGAGFATEAAAAALDDAFARQRLSEVLAYTAPDNLRSQAVIRRLGLHRETARDFNMPEGSGGAWHGLVWSARR